jgi:SAM-dependent methyltransferase
VAEPSALILRQLEALRAAGSHGAIVDLACGRGRNTLALAHAGLDCTGFDRNDAQLRELVVSAAGAPGRVEAVRCDLESGHEIPIRPASCGAILVFRFLFRPLAPAIERLLAPGGLLLYETFTREQPAHGWGPKSPEFLLEPGELARMFPGLDVIEYDETPILEPRPEASARLVARRPAR